MKRLAALLATAALAATAFAAPAQAAPSDFGFDSVSASLSTHQAGAHPDFTTVFELKQDPSAPLLGGVRAPFANAKDVTVETPPGLIGNPGVVEHCTVAQLVDWQQTGCPNGSQVGLTNILSYFVNPIHEPVYMMTPPGGDVVARLGFVAWLTPTVIDIRLVPKDDNRLVATASSIPSQFPLVVAETTLWGVPADPSHDAERMTAAEAEFYAAASPPRPPGGPRLAFMTNPTSCGSGKQVGFGAISWSLPESPVAAAADLPTITGCDILDFRPSIALVPTTRRADSPSGMDVDLSLPQDTITDPNGLAEANLKKAVVTLPPGASLNPAAAAGLQGCSTAQIGLISTSPIRFNGADPACPDASKVGTAEITTPVLPDPIQGSLYLAKQGDNPFDTLLSGYLVAQGQGVTLKLAGRFDADPNTGQITATFDNNPQQPFNDVKLHFKGGPHGVLITPPACGTYPIVSRFTPWSATDPNNPTPAEVATRTSTFTIDQGPGGGPCPGGGLDPRLDAGATNPIAGSHSPFVLRLSRDDGSQRFSALDVATPEGLVAKLAGVPYCPDSALASFPNPPLAGSGLAELNSPACPAASLLGSVSVGAGAGDPFYVNTGRVYLAGPYQGAPLSLAILTPAVAGPFDLGTVLVRSAINVDPTTARVSVRSDPIPAILDGIPLDVRDIRVAIDRPDFMLNPTSCDPMSVDATVHGAQGATAAVSNRFQVGGCRGLGFKPKLSMKLIGGKKVTTRSKNPGLLVTLKPRAGDANIRSTQVTLTDAFQIDQRHLGNICSQKDLAANDCAGKHQVGTVSATTPLLDNPLSGPVYAVSGPNSALPQLAFVLHGQFDALVTGDNKGVGNHLRTTFPAIPDVPVTSFQLMIDGGSGGYLVNTRDVCAATNTSAVQMVGHNGKTETLKVPIQTPCAKPHKKRKHHKRHHHRVALG